MFASPETVMARPKGRPKAERSYATVKIEVGVLSLVGLVAGAENKTKADWITDTLEPIARKRVAELAVEMSKPKKK